MNYACRSNRPFTTSKEVKKRKSMSEEAKSRRAYIATHNFSVHVNPSTMEGSIEVTKNI